MSAEHEEQIFAGLAPLSLPRSPTFPPSGSADHNHAPPTPGTAAAAVASVSALVVETFSSLT